MSWPKEFGLTSFSFLFVAFDGGGGDMVEWRHIKFDWESYCAIELHLFVTKKDILKSSRTEFPKFISEFLVTLIYFTYFI